MNTNYLEIIIGGVVLFVAGFFLYSAYSSTSMNTTDGYTLTANFDRIDGLARGNDVRLSGVKIGSVTDMTVNPETYLAVVTLNVSPDIKLPTDSSAEIVGDGLLGGKYVSLVPGAEDEMIAEGGLIQFTQAAISLESLIGQFMFSNKDEAKTEEKSEEKPEGAS